jgi:hypothetical protein
VASERPKARRDGLLVRDLGDELVVYELGSHRGHSLNRTAALVWRSCDGKRSVAAIAARVGRALGAAPDEDLVRYAVRRLRSVRLLDPSSPGAPSLTRRQLARRIGQLALLPVVVSLLAPRPSEAATCTPATCPGGVCTCSGEPDGTACWNGSNCGYVCCAGTSCCSGCNSGTPVAPCYP